MSGARGGAGRRVHGGSWDVLRSAVPEVSRPWWRFVGSILLAAAASASSVALMACSAWLLSRAAEHPPILYLQVAIVGVRFFGIARGFFRYVERLVGHDLALRMQTALRINTYGRLAQTTLLGRRRGDLLSRLIADVEAVQDLVVRVAIPFASASLVIVATTAMFATFSPWTAAWLFASAVFAGIVVPWLARLASRTADAESVPLRGELADVVRELSRTAPDLVAYGADAAHLDRLVDVDARLRAAEARSSWVRGIAAGGQILASGVAVIAALVIGGRAVAADTLAPVMLAVLVLTPLALHEVMNTLAQAAQTFTRARAALDRVDAVLKAPLVGVGDRPASAVAPDPTLAVTGLSVGWPGSEALLADLSLNVGPGEKVALVGPSGIGKTTLAATLLGLIPPMAGTVDVRGRIGYLAQDAHIFATSLAENVRIGKRDASDAEIAAALHRAGLYADPGRVVGELGTTLSGGEARRLALSRLFVGDYQVLVLDEPTEHLDVETATGLIDDIWSQAADKPLLVISHDAAVIERCDRVVVLA